MILPLALTTPTRCFTFCGKEKAKSKEKEKRECIKPKQPKYGECGIYTSSIKKHKKKNLLPERPILSSEVFFINMMKYGRDESWADGLKFTTWEASEMLSTGESFKNTLNYVAQSVKKLAFNDSWGKLEESGGLYTIKNQKRGMEYVKKYKSKLKEVLPKGFITPKAMEGYEDANVCMILSNGSNCFDIYYGRGKGKTGKNIELAQNEYKKLRAISNPTLDEINKSVAIIHWLIAQETPFKRGSDSIANVMTKAIYDMYDIELSSPKKGCSFDFEAFCTDMEDYVKIYPHLFSVPPKKYNATA